ncbi:hypothetical protein RUM43_004957 [Polyplax serrata]|uniref:Uncharacterized protein n=1 Tax=Polyplax serrata TaxID=468196 RepID=A0AAN8XQV2_POLSC
MTSPGTEKNGKAMGRKERERERENEERLLNGVAEKVLGLRLTFWICCGSFIGAKGGILGYHRKEEGWAIRVGPLLVTAADSAAAAASAVAVSPAFLKNFCPPNRLGRST